MVVLDVNDLQLSVKQVQLTQILQTNERTEAYGLSLTPSEAEMLLDERRKTLKCEQRVELGESILPKLIQTFASSRYIMQSNYCESLIRLQEIFFAYKNEMADELTDEELLNIMQELFETVCAGDLDYLAGTCLEIFAQAVRAGYRGYQQTVGRGEFAQFDIVTRWDESLYLETLRDLIWR